MDLLKLKEKSELALNAMEEHANKIGTPGVAVVLYSDKDSGKDYYSFTRVIGAIKRIDDDQSGYNFFALVYSKIAESIETGKESGNLKRPLITGEFGYGGSAVYNGSDGLEVTCFSGSSEEVDCAISETGMKSLRLKK